MNYHNVSMMKTPTGKYAIVRRVPNTYNDCIRANEPARRIVVNKAREQHRLYCNALEKLGLTLIKIDSDDRFPDCCFVEDTAIVAGNQAIISRLGIKSRQGEEVAVEKVLAEHLKTLRIHSPARIEGGDVLSIHKKIYIGLSERTNRFAVQQLKSLVLGDGYQVIPIKIQNMLHLKTGCTYLGNNCIILAPGHFDEAVLAEYKKLIIPKEESYAANCLSINGRVLMPKGFPQTKRMIENEGFETIEIEMSEFRKGDGGLTCLSIIF